MENTADKMLKPKRVRSNPPRKWTVEEEKQLIEFLMENRELEKPTAQTYYRRFSMEKNLNIEWQLVRAKVRNLRVGYNKAKAWEGSTGVGNMDGSTIKSTLLKMCIHFDELEEIFGRRMAENIIIEESLESSDQTTSDSAEILNETSTATDSSSQDCLPSTSRKGIYSRTAVSDIMKMQNEVFEIKRSRLDFEKSAKEREIKVLEKNIELKEKELQLKEKEIENQREIQMLELEMKERIAMEELRLKYSK